MTAWLLIVGITVCYFGLVGCAVAWARLPQPVDELAARRERRAVRVIRAPFDFEREELA